MSRNLNQLKLEVDCIMNWIVWTFFTESETHKLLYSSQSLESKAKLSGILIICKSAR